MRFGKFAIGALIAGATVALAASPGAMAQKRGGTLTYAVVAGPPTYDMHGTNSFAVMHFVSPHYSTLLTFDWDNYPKLVGDLAESWTVSPDGLTYTFKVRGGVKFHDGTPFTSEDIKASYDRLRAPPKGVISVRKTLLADIASIATPDSRTVVFKLSAANPFILTGFASPFNAIYSAKDISKNPRFPQKNVNGTGPFRFVEHVAGSHWLGKRYENYHVAGKPYLDGFRAIQLKGTALINALAGERVFAEFRGVAPPQRAQLVKDMGKKITFQSEVLMTEWVISLSQKFKPFEDKRVRQALNLAVDRYTGLGQLAKVTFTAAQPAGIVLPGSKFALSSADLEKLPGFGRDIDANRKKARQLLKEAGHANLKFVLSNRAVPHPYNPIGIFLIDQWRRIGVTVTMDSQVTAKYVKIRRGGNFQAILDFAPSFSPDPTVAAFKFISRDKSPSNYGRYTDRMLDDLYEKQKREIDPAKRKALVNQFERRVINQAWVLPVSYTQRTIPLHAKVKGYVIAPSHILNNNLRDIWINE